MITGVQDVYYEVQDMKRAVAFYRNVLNLAVIEESEDWSAMNVGGLRVGLDSTDGKPTPKRAILTLKTTDIRADVKILRDKRVKFVGEIGDYPWGSVVTLEDSGGNYLKLMQTPK
ncbi:MAG TPA: VOC family protein [Thermoplasmata archaeon]|nr:VOC family protein [Thermoplasmata archaeon]